ncbi:glycoside hydrolase family 97 N-terminal domain-containing protein [Streptomyces sp. NPDC003233]
MSGPQEPSRRRVLKGAAVAAATAALGIGSTYPSEASDPSVTATSPDGTTSITMSLTGGSLQWSARRKGATVVAGSAMGLRLSDGTTLGTDDVLTNYQHWHVDRTWNPVYGRNATVLDAYQEMRWNLQDKRTSINFGVQIRAYATGVAFRYVLLDSGTATIAGELTTFAFPDRTLVYSARDEDDYNPVAPGSIPPTGTSSTDSGPLTDLPLTATYSGGLIACVCESDRVNYPRLMVSSVSGQPNTLAAYLMQHTARGSGTAQTTFSRRAVRPWRRPSGSNRPRGSRPASRSRTSGGRGRRR